MSDSRSSRMARKRVSFSGERRRPVASGSAVSNRSSCRLVRAMKASPSLNVMEETSSEKPITFDSGILPCCCCCVERIVPGIVWSAKRKERCATVLVIAGCMASMSTAVCELRRAIALFWHTKSGSSLSSLFTDELCIGDLSKRIYCSTGCGS